MDQIEAFPQYKPYENLKDFKNENQLSDAMGLDTGHQASPTPEKGKSNDVETIMIGDEEVVRGHEAVYFYGVFHQIHF